MALDAGSASLDVHTGVVTGTGLALLLCNGFAAFYSANTGASGAPKGSDGFANFLATVLVDYLKANVEVHAGTMTAGGDPVTGTGSIT